MERGKGSIEDDPGFPNQTSGLKCHSVLWFRDVVSKEVAVRSLLDVLSVTSECNIGCVECNIQVEISGRQLNMWFQNSKHTFELDTFIFELSENGRWFQLRESRS